MERYHVEWAFLDDAFVPHTRGLASVRIEGRQIFQDDLTVLTCCAVPVAKVTTLAVRWAIDAECPSLLRNHGTSCGVLMAIEPRFLALGDTAQPAWTEHMLTVGFYETVA